jgi:hypothetical protein
MARVKKIIGTDEAWENGELGCDEEFVKVVSHDIASQIDACLGLKNVSIQLDGSLLSALEQIAEFHKLDVRAMVIDNLERFVICEMKQIVQSFNKERTVELEIESMHTQTIEKQAA